MLNGVYSHSESTPLSYVKSQVFDVSVCEDEEIRDMSDGVFLQFISYQCREIEKRRKPVKGRGLQNVDNKCFSLHSYSSNYQL